MDGIPIPVWTMLIGLVAGAVIPSYLLWAERRSHARLQDRFMARSLSEYKANLRIDSEPASPPEEPEEVFDSQRWRQAGPRLAE